MDYCLETSKMHLLFNKEFNELIIEQMHIEAEYIFKCLEAGIVLEADNNSSKKISLWQRIKEFFAKLIAIFKEKTIT